MPAFTQSQYNALCSAIAQGVTSVQYGDKNVTYRSLSEMRSIKREMEIELGMKIPSKTHYPKHSKGFK